MDTKEVIQEAVRTQFNLPEHGKSRLLKEHRIVMSCRRVTCEMLETYRYPGDRDNDITFIPYLLDLGIKKGIIINPFERKRIEKRLAFYSLKLNQLQIATFEAVRLDKGWNIQTLLINAVYTGLLHSFPDFEIGSQWRVQALRYPSAYQPNIEWLQYTNCIATVCGKNNVRDPWIECEIDHEGTTVKKFLRKDFLHQIFT